MKNPNIAVKDRWVEAVFAGDREAIRQLADPDFELYQSPGLAYEGVYKGVDGFFDFLDRFLAAYELESLEPTALYVEQTDPDRLALGFQIKGRLRASGKRFESPQLECWDFRNGKVVRIRVFWFQMP
jgi:ketosteroid isomerase-like protein